MSKTFTQAQVTAIVAQTVALTLAQLQAPSAPVVAPKPSLRAAKRKRNATKRAAAQAAREAARVRKASQRAAGLALVTTIAQAKATIGVHYPTTAQVEALGLPVPAGTTACVLSSLGTLYLYGPTRATLGTHRLPLAQAAALRAQSPRKGA